MNKNNELLKTRLGVAGGVIPLGLFLGIIVVTVIIKKGIGMTEMIVAEIIGLSIGMFFVRDRKKYWAVVRGGMGSPSVTVVVQIYMLAAIFGTLVSIGHLAGGLIWFGHVTRLTGAAFCAFTFLATAIVGTATGTSFGTWAVMVPAFFPAGVVLGANPLLLAGALISGGAFGDNIAPISDTTIISASTQEYSKKSGFADIGGVVRTRLKYALAAGTIALVLYAVLGGGGTHTLPIAEAGKLLAQYSSPQGLLLLIPVVLVIILAMKTAQIGMSLIMGIIVALVVGFSARLFTFGEVWKALPGGVQGFFTVCIMFMIVMGIMQVMVKTGALESFIEWTKKHIAKTSRGVEILMWSFVSIADVVVVGGSTRSVAISGALVNSLGKVYHIHPYRRANILDATANTVSYFLPFGICMLFFVSLIDMSAKSYPFITVPSPMALVPTVYYSWALWGVMFLSALTGWGRIFEGKNGKVINGNFTNKIPKEAIEE